MATKKQAAHKRRKNEVVIVGYAPGRESTPFDNPDVEIWGMNDIWAHWTQWPKLRPRWDAWFELHHRDVVVNNPRTGTEHLKWLQEQSIPVYMLERCDDIPSSRAFPLKDVMQHFGASHPYFTSTPAYMVALAVMMGYSAIHVYGINLLGMEEYEYQRPCMEYWIGVAEGRGIKVHLNSSTLCRAAYRYGFDTHGGQDGGMRDFAKVVRAKRIEHQERARHLDIERAKLEGANAVMGWFADMFGHVLRGGYVLAPKGVPPEAAELQQKRDLAETAMRQVREIVSAVQGEDGEVRQRALEHLPNVVAALTQMPDQWEVSKR